MFVYCRKCGWSQDDFYSRDGYNPTKFLIGLNEDLFGDLDKIVHFEELVDGKPLYPDITVREWIARYYEEYAKRIREMKWVTADDFYNDPNKVCPKCGSDDLSTD